jgi:hypothetical protein
MAHLHLIEDQSGDVVDYIVFCSAFCHQTGVDEYPGWNGCHEISTTTPCENCGDTVPGLDE